MYLIYNNDGSIKFSLFEDFVIQGSDNVNFIYVAIEDRNVEEWTCDASFLLPDNETTLTSAGSVDNFTIDGHPYTGYKIPLTQSITSQSGNMSVSVRIYSTGDQLLYTYPATIVVNESTISWDADISYANYRSYLAQLSAYQLAFVNSNVRGYASTASAIADLSNLAANQIVVAYDTLANVYRFFWKQSGNLIELKGLEDVEITADSGTNAIQSIKNHQGTFYPTKLVSFEYVATNEKSIPIGALVSLNLPYNTNYLYYNTYNKQLYYYFSSSASLLLIGALQNLFQLTWDTDGYVITNGQRVTILNTIKSVATNFIIFEFSGGDYDGRRYLMNYHNSSVADTYNLVCVDFEVDTENQKVSQFEKFKITISTTLGSVKGTWTEVSSDNVSAVDGDTFIIGDTTYNIPSDVSDLNNDAGYLTASSSTITTMQSDISGKQDALPSTVGNNNKYLHINDITGSLEWSSLSVPTGAFTYIGTTTTQLSDGSTTNPITIGGESVTATNGNVVFYGDAEFVWIGSAWEELGNKNQATSSVLGNIKLGSDTTIDGTASKVYPIQLNSSGQAFVYVPWTDTPTDLSNYVTLNTAQTITGTKTFNDFRLQSGNYDYWTFVAGSNYLDISTYYSNALRTTLTIGRSDLTSRLNIIPNASNSFDLGSNTKQWKNVYLLGNLSDGTNSIAVANIASKSEVNAKQDTLTTGSVNTGTIETAIGFDNNGDLVKGSLPSGVDNISIVNALPSTSDAQNNILYKLNNDLYALTETEQATPVISYANGTITVTCDYDAETIELYANGNKVGTIDLTGGNN